MPGKYKTSKYGDDYESDDFEATDTLIGRNRVPASPSKKKTRPTSAYAAKKKTSSPRRPVTPGKKRKRPQSAPLHRSGHELWMNAIKQRATAYTVVKRRVSRKDVGLASNRRPPSPRHKTAGEFWIDTLRKTGQGFSTESTGMNTFNGKRPRDRDMPYLSTPAYLRQMAGTEKPGKASDPTVRASPGTPAYKSQEEYYEQILEYKKQVSSMNQDAGNLKAKIRRLEEDNLKKEKEIDALLHPHKSEELRRTLTDKRPDSGSVIHSLKQKILKLETQLRDKETSYIKLQSDLKTTKIDEMKQQMEVFYSEIMRLQNSKDTGMDKSSRPASRDGNVKMKALNETVLRLNKANEQLQSENRAMKDDLKNALNDDDKGHNREYEDMNRKELLRTVNQLEKKLERAEKQFDGSSIVSYESKAPKVHGKIALDGSLEDRLDQLDKRESELIEALEKKTEQLKKVSEEKNRWKKRCEEMERLLSSAGDYDYSADSRTKSRASSAATRPPSSRRDSQRPPSARTRDAESTEVTPRNRPLSSRRPTSAKRRSSIDSGVSSVRRQKIKDFKENRSAKTIQRKWRSHQEDQRHKHNAKVDQFQQNYAAKKIQKHWTSRQYKKQEKERDEATDLIRSALMGHSSRQDQMKHSYHDDTETDYMTEDENYNDCVNLIQSAMLGHSQRRTNMRDYRLSSTGEDDDDDTDIMESPSRRGGYNSSLRSINRPQSPSVNRQRPQSGKSRPSSSVKSSSFTASYKGRGQSSYGEGDDDF